MVKLQEEEEKQLKLSRRSWRSLEKMLIAIDIKRKNIYSSYAINFRPPEDRKPTSQEIKRYSIFLKEHISIIRSKNLILMGSTAMEAVTVINRKISMKEEMERNYY